MGKMNDENSFLLGSESVPSASFLTKGTTHEGEILDLKMRQQLDIKTRKPMFWDNGDPKMQLVVTLQTEEIDDEIEDDDGRRRLYVKFKLRDAIAEAVREADAIDSGLEVGGWLSVTFTGQDKPTKRGYSGVKNYEAAYEAPDPNAASNAYLTSDDPEDDPVEEDEPVEEAPKATKRTRKATAPAAASEPAEKPARGRARASRPAGTSRSKYVADESDDEAF